MNKGFSTLSFVSGLTLGVLFTGGWFLRDTSSFPAAQYASNVATSTKGVTEKSTAISISDQPSGNEVTVESVTVPPPGVWIAVRDVAASGDLGNVLGAARAGGPRSSVVIPLLRATEPGRSYAVELYRDDGGGAFDPAINSVYVDFNTGERVVANFKTTE